MVAKSRQDSPLVTLKAGGRTQAAEMAGDPPLAAAPTNWREYSMTAAYFTEKSVPPSESSIATALGRAAGAWGMLFERMGAEHPDLSADWNYYADGKSWLLKVSRKAKTVFWGSVEEGAFRVTFYFAERLLPELLASGLSDERKAEIRAGAPVGKLRPVSVVFGPQRGVRDVMTLIELKKRLK